MGDAAELTRSAGGEDVEADDLRALSGPAGLDPKTAAVGEELGMALRDRAVHLGVAPRLMVVVNSLSALQHLPRAECCKDAWLVEMRTLSKKRACAAG